MVQQEFSDQFTKQWNAPAQDWCSRVHSLTAALEQTIQYVYHLRIIISVLTDSLTVPGGVLGTGGYPSYFRMIAFIDEAGTRMM